jgi:hypothetical protein
MGKSRWRMRKTVIASPQSPDAETVLRVWDDKMRKNNLSYGTVRTKHTLKRVGLDPKDFKIRSSLNKKGSNTKINYQKFGHDAKVRLVEKVPALVENGMDITIIVMNQLIFDVLIEYGNPSSDPELAVHGVHPGKFIYWTADEKNNFGRDLMLTFKDANAVHKAKEYVDKLKVK